MNTLQDINWLAGFLEGEGCFYFNRNACRVQVVQKDPWPLMRMQQIVGGNVTRVRGGCKNQLYYALFIVGKRAIGIMMTVYPLLSPRRQQKIASNLAQWRTRPLRGKSNIKTHCKRGHELTPDNTFIRADGKGRECIDCRDVHYETYRQKKLKLVNS